MGCNDVRFLTTFLHAMLFRSGLIPLLPGLIFLLIPTRASAQLKADSLIQVLKTSPEDTNKVILYRMLTGVLANSNPTEAIRYGKNGVSLGKKLSHDKGTAGCYLNLSFAYGAVSQIDSAMQIIDSAIVWSRKAAEPARISLAYLNRGDLQLQLRNLNQALADCDTALHYAELSNNNDRRARVLQTIGSVYFIQENYPESKQYYQEAAKLYEQLENKKMSAIIFNNLGNVDKRTANYTDAIAQFRKALVLADEAGDKISLSMYYGNLSDAYLSAGLPEQAEQNARLAMRHALEQGNEVQTAVCNNYLAQIYLYKKRYNEAIEVARKAYEINQKYTLLEGQNTAAEILAEAHRELGHHKEAYLYLERSKALHDSLTKQKYDEEIAALETSFKIKEKNREIELLSKTHELQEQRISRQRIILGGTISLTLLLAAGVLLWFSRHRMQQQIAEMQLRNSIAADLHDDVGSSLSSICMLSEMASASGISPSSKDELITKVSAYSRETMKKMGDIVWMIKPAEDEGFDLMEKMERFLYELCDSKGITGRFHGEEFRIPKLAMEKRKALYLIFKESVNNALKYASPQTISVHLRHVGNHIEMKVSDDGKGFDLVSAPKGNGITNLQNRALEVGGSVKIISSPGEGTTVSCQIPE